MAYDGVAEGPREHSRFLIVRRHAEDADVLVLRFPDGQTALPVFGLEEEAGMFLWLETAGDGWRVAEISEADVAVLLCDSCAGVWWIVHPFAAKGVGKGPMTVNREDFLRKLGRASSPPWSQGGTCPGASRSPGRARGWRRDGG